MAAGARVAKSKKTDKAPGDSSSAAEEAAGTVKLGQIKIKADLVRKVNQIAKWRQKKIWQVLDAQLRSFILPEFEKVQQEMKEPEDS